MPKKDGIKRPRQPFRRISKLFLLRFWLKDGAPERYIPRRSPVYDDTGLFFVKSFEHVHDYYIRLFYGVDPNPKDAEGERLWRERKNVEGRGPLITLAEGMIYNDILLLAKRGEATSDAEYAVERGIARHTVRAAIDNLANVNLCHRERSPDGSEHVFIIVPHTPLSLPQLLRQYNELLERRERGHVQELRRAANGKHDWMPKSFSWKKLLASFGGNEEQAERFENVVGHIVHTHLTDRDYSRGDFLDDVEEWCQKLKIKTVAEHKVIAVEIKDYIRRIV